MENAERVKVVAQDLKSKQNDALCYMSSKA